MALKITGPTQSQTTKVCRAKCEHFALCYKQSFVSVIIQISMLFSQAENGLEVHQGLQSENTSSEVSLGAAVSVWLCV